MEKKESIKYYFNEFDLLLKNANRQKFEKFVFGVLSIIVIIIFYFRKDILKLDLINCISLYFVFQFIVSSIFYIKTTQKMRTLSDDFIKDGLFDESDEEAKIIYNNYIEHMNRFIK